MTKGMHLPGKDAKAQAEAKSLVIINEKYKELFPDNEGTEPLRGRANQLIGRTRLVHLKNGKDVYVHERYGFSSRDYLHMEIEKNTSTGQPGWIDNPKYRVDYVAFIHLADGVVYLFDWKAFRKVWKEWQKDWLEGYVSKETWNPGYNTIHLNVPARLVLRLMGKKESKAVTFPPLSKDELDAMKGRGKFKKGSTPPPESGNLFGAHP